MIFTDELTDKFTEFIGTITESIKFTDKSSK